MDITKIKAVAELRQNLALAKNIKDEAYEAWKVHNSGYFAAVETLTALVQEAESALRSEALGIKRRDPVWLSRYLRSWNMTLPKPLNGRVSTKWRSS